MKKYLITVFDDFFNLNLSGDFFADNEEAAKQEAREFYAQELDTTENDVKIVSCVLVD